MPLSGISVLAIVTSAGAASFLAAAVAVSPKRTRSTHLPLLGCSAVIVYSTVAVLSRTLGFWNSLPPFLSIPLPYYFLFPPSLYLYVVKLLDPSRELGWRRVVHTVPFLVCMFFLWPHFSASSDVRWAFNRGAEASRLKWFLSLALMISTTAYLTASWGSIQVRIAAAQESRSSLEPFRFGYLKALVAALGLVWLYLAVVLVTSFDPLAIDVGSILLSSLLPALVVFSLRCSPVLRDLSLELRIIAKEREEESSHQPRYATSGMSREKVSEYAKRMCSYLETSRCFLDSDLKAEDLARALRITEYQVSQVINTGLGESFFSLINRYRIEEAKKRLSRTGSDEADSILKISYEVGFNSKSAFNRAFRKYTGMTPSQFREAVSQTPEPQET